jgi:hypothetical protein
VIAVRADLLIHQRGAPPPIRGSHARTPERSTRVATGHRGVPEDAESLTVEMKARVPVEERFPPNKGLMLTASGISARAMRSRRSS